MTHALIHFFQRFPTLRPYTLLSLAILVLGIFFFFPLLIMLLYSFAQRDTYGGIKVIQDFGAYLKSMNWLNNYIRSFEPIYLEIYFRSLWMAVLTTILCLIIGYPIAYFIALRTKPSVEEHTFDTCDHSILDFISDPHVCMGHHSSKRRFNQSVPDRRRSNLEPD